MLVSHDPPFLFVHIDKAAGSNIQHALRPFMKSAGRSKLRRLLGLLGPLNRVGGLYTQLEFSEHAPARKVRSCLPPAWYSRLYKFAFVRNPWDRLVSRHAYLLRKKEHPHSQTVNALGGFDAYLKWELSRGPRNGGMRHQADYVTGEDGRLIVDYVGYFETLAEDFDEVCRRIGVPASLPPAKTHSPRQDYRSFYSEEARKLVAEAYARDIELFGYTFEGTGERRNRGLPSATT
ncbi:MAG: sulfotransferase family 2 domain-containing protein [Chthoniobacterales bacterium]